MKGLFIESHTFKKTVYEYLSDMEYAEIQESLIRTPDLGDVMEGTGGVRKIRLKTTIKRKGKRGGARLIYLYVKEVKVFYLFAIYGKNVHQDLDPKIKSRLHTFVVDLKKWIKDHYKESIS